MNDDQDWRIRAGTIVRPPDPAAARPACCSSSARLRSATVTLPFIGAWTASASYVIDNLNRFVGRDIAGANNIKTDGSTSDAGVRTSDTISPRSAAWSPKWYCRQVLFERNSWPRGLYHGARPMHLQGQLNELICHFNRRPPRPTGSRSLFPIAVRRRSISHCLLIQSGLETKAAAIDRRSSSSRIFALWPMSYRSRKLVYPIQARKSI